MLAAAAATLSLLIVASVVQPAHAQGNNDFDTPTVFQAAGPNAPSIQASIDQFRAALGGNNNGNAAGPLLAGRREINWDGGGSSATSPGPSPFTVFLNSRGAFITTPGSGFVQAPLDGLVSTFGNLTYDSIFQPFSPVRFFSPVGSNVTDVTFFVPGGGNVSAATRGFGVVFSDVDQPDGSGPGGKRGNRGASTLVQYYGAGGQLLYSSFVPASPGDASLSFFAVLFSDARIAHVRITTGDVQPGVDDEAHRDIVMMDDFVYGEPQALP
jgi:hypothetical protein